VLKKREKVNMSDDLVKRLRKGVMCGDDPIVDEAADRIEKLEAALRAIIVHCEVPAPPNAEALKMFARKALEGENAAQEPI
jgi:hypothetical protein